MDVSPDVLSHQLEVDLLSVEHNMSRPSGLARHAACAALSSSLLKKFTEADEDSAALRQTLAFDKFLKVNEACRMYSFSESTRLLPSWGRQVVGDVIDRIYHGTMAHDGLRFTHRDVFLSGYFGPGASAGSRGTSEYQKRTGPMGCTNKGLHDLWKADTASCSLEATCELLRSFSGHDVVIQAGSKLSFAPKNRSIDRTICTEPTLNGYYQLGVGIQLTKLLSKRFGIDLPNQQFINRELARTGSVTGQYATIDLSSASDSISISLVENILPRELFQLLMRYRSSTTSVNLSFTGEQKVEEVQLAMISSMGNGYTFPLQTMIFAAIVLAVYDMCGITARGAFSRMPNYGVNGDDIIVDVRAFSLVCEVLHAFGFTLNSEKTFSEGPFRESCGGDYFYGHYVRGVYCKSLETYQDVVSVINRLNVWSARWNVNLPNTVGYLLAALRRKFFVPRWEMDTAGIKIPAELMDAVGLRLRTCQFTQSVLYQRWVARPAKLDVELDVDWPLNEAGLLLTSITGTTRNRNVYRRSNKPSYEKRVGVAPCWDQYYDPSQRDLTVPFVSLRRWTAAVRANMQIC